MGSASLQWVTSIIAWNATRTLLPRSVLDARIPSLALVQDLMWYLTNKISGMTSASTAKSVLQIWPTSVLSFTKSRCIVLTVPKSCNLTRAAIL